MSKDLSIVESGDQNKTDKFEGIALKGPPEFIDRTKRALTTLKRTRGYERILPYLGMIRAAERSGMSVYDEVPTYEVGVATWGHSDMWYASTIAHDGYHSVLYHEAKAKSDGNEPHAEKWIGEKAERECLEFQLSTLKELGADKELLIYVERFKASPTYQGDHKSWEDYQKRSW